MHRCAFETFEIMGDTRYIWVILSACAASYWIGACLRVDKAVIIRRRRNTDKPNKLCAQSAFERCITGDRFVAVMP